MNKSEKCSSTQVGRMVIHKDDTEKRIYKNELQIPEETKRRMSEERMGHPVSEETKRKISAKRSGYVLSPESKEKFLKNCYKTRKKNKTFNSSSTEDTLFEEFKAEFKNKTVLRQYKDPERYPFYCDFYIVEDDLFIEYNGHWTHGGKPFDPLDPECIEMLKQWEEKAKQSQFYQAAIDTWTRRDVEKLECAKKHKLNYKVIY